MPDLLVEIGCEELPAAACRQAEAQLPGLLEAALARAGIARGRAARPRRAPAAGGARARPPGRAARPSAPRCAGRARRRPSRRWPASPASTVSSRPALERRDGFVWAISEGAPTPAADLVPDLVRGLVDGIQFSKSMRWEGGRFSRPIRWLVVKLDDEVVPMRLAGVESGDTTSGHRYEGGHARLGTAAATSTTSGRRGRWPTAASGGRRSSPAWTRRARGRIRAASSTRSSIWSSGRWCSRAGSTSATWSCPSGWSMTAMQSHQRYFPVRRVGAALEPRFLFVANGGDPDVVRAGNEEVLVGPARRRRVRLPARPRARRSRRWRPSSAGSASSRARGRWPTRSRGWGRSSSGCARRTPSRRTCARRRCGPPPCARPISCPGSSASSPTLEGYAGSRLCPGGRRGRGGRARRSRSTTGRARRAATLPASDAGAVLAVADKADTLAVAFGLGLEPTGSRDPFGLRRAAAGVVAIALDAGLCASSRTSSSASGRRGSCSTGSSRLLLDEGVTVEEVRAARGSGASSRSPWPAWPAALHAFAGPGARRRPRRLQPLRAHRRRHAAGRRRTPRSCRSRPSGPGRSDAPTPPGDAGGCRGARAGGEPLLRRGARDGPDEAVRGEPLALVANAAAILRRCGDSASCRDRPCVSAGRPRPRPRPAGRDSRAR